MQESAKNKGKTAMVRIGIVGIGFMGWIHYLAGKHLKNAELTAICSRDPIKLAGDWHSIRGNFGPPGTMVDLGGIKRYETPEVLFDDPEIDLIDICNPTHLHRATAIAALRAGKHVLVEKPIALTPEDADAMVAAAKEAGRLLMVAHVLPFVPEFQFAADTIRSGRFGKLLSGHFRRIISRPDWSAEMADASKTGGPAIDLHIHDTHFIGLVCGVPQSVFSTGVVKEDAVEHLTTQYFYGPNGPSITCSSGALAMPGRPFVHGYELYFERATLIYESGAIPLTVLTQDGKSERVNLPGGDDPIAAFVSEIQCAVDGVAAGKMPELLNGSLARDALVMCYRECESVKSGKIIEV